MIKYTKYQEKLPSAFLRELLLTPPKRHAEIQCFYDTLTIEALFSFFNGSLFFSEDEQIAHDADIECKRSNHSGLNYLPTLSQMVGYTAPRCVQILNRCEGICVLREKLKLDPIPPRFYPNLFFMKLDFVPYKEEELDIYDQF